MKLGCFGRKKFFKECSVLHPNKEHFQAYFALIDRNADGETTLEEILTTYKDIITSSLRQNQFRNSLISNLDSFFEQLSYVNNDPLSYNEFKQMIVRLHVAQARYQYDMNKAKGRFWLTRQNIKLVSKLTNETQSHLYKSCIKITNDIVLGNNVVLQKYRKPFSAVLLNAALNLKLVPQIKRAIDNELRVFGQQQLTEKEFDFGYCKLFKPEDSVYTMTKEPIMNDNPADPCKTGEHTCNLKAVCNSLSNGAYDCTCRDGYEGNGFDCSPINVCISGRNQCHKNADCKSDGTAHTCTCRTGYFGDGRNCKDIDECSTNQHECPSGATCINSEGAYGCDNQIEKVVCPDGYYEQNNECKDLDECESNRHHCHRTKSCVNKPGSYDCQCKTGYKLRHSWQAYCERCKSIRKNFDKLSTITTLNFRCSLRDKGQNKQLLMEWYRRHDLYQISRIPIRNANY